MKNDLGDVFMVLDGVFTLVATYIKRCKVDFSVIKLIIFLKKISDFQMVIRVCVIAVGNAQMQTGPAFCRPRQIHINKSALSLFT
ncbi:MAG TPA: hypothetical protein DCQ34_10040 [Chitinophagaceae bacterium]|nr:hypothetical protein [Chitinophagaceae bacterium]